MAAIKTLPSIVLIFVLASCGIRTSSATTASIPTLTPPPAATVENTATAKATPAPTETPAPTGLNAAGPHVLFKGASGIWIANPDGSFLTQIIGGGTYGIWTTNSYARLRDAISPAGDRLALVMENDQGLDLEIVKIPSGDAETIAHLISLTRADENNYPASQKAFAAYAIRDYPDVAWQPVDGRLLAFTGATNGPTSDLYLYDTQTRETRQLTSGLSQSISPVWSPDGQYILNFGVSFAASSTGAIGPDRLDGVWAARASDGKLTVLPKPEGLQPQVIAWQDDSHYIMSLHDDKLNTNILTSVDVASGETKPIMDYHCYGYIAQSPENGALLFSSASGCASSLGEGTFLLLPGQATPLRLLDKQTWEINWLPESSVFYAYPEALLSSDGKTRYDPPVIGSSEHPTVSKAGYQAWVVIEKQVGHVVVKIPGQDWQTVFNGGADQLIWDPVQGKTLLIASHGTLYAASYPGFTPRAMGSLGAIDQAIWLP